LAYLLQNAFSQCSKTFVPSVPHSSYGLRGAHSINVIDADINIDNLANGLGGIYSIRPALWNSRANSDVSKAAIAAKAAAAANAAARASRFGVFGGLGNGEITASGPIGAAGTAFVGGTVPVLGSVAFDGTLPAGGAVYLNGNCGCAHLA
jgi:hypothetical protein